MRCVMNERAAALVLTAVVFAGLAACRRADAPRPPANGQVPQSPPAAAAVPHGDHNPHHGGVVMMKGDLHYEIVVDASGRAHRLYFSDAVREDLPASLATGAMLTIRRPAVADEVIPLRIDDTGESWIGSGRPIADRATTTVRVAFTLRGGDEYAIDLPADPAAAADRQPHGFF